MNFIHLAKAATPDNNWWIIPIYLVALGGIFYFMILRPQKKRKKDDERLRGDLQVGDEIVTIGGVCGKVVSLKEDSIVIESGPDRTKIKFEKNAIGKNLTAANRG